MKVNLNWLNKLVNINNIKTEELVRKINLHTTEIENVSRVLEGNHLVVGKVIECYKHPDSDHLSVTKVDIKSEVLQIVCGASNIKKDLFIIVALIGCVLPNNFTIKKTTIRGVESSGMICSLTELGMDKKFIDPKYLDGIFYFEGFDISPGDDPLKILGYEREVIELGVTPNRADLLSMRGVAYDVACVFGLDYKEDFKTVEYLKNKNRVKIRIDTTDCQAYYACYIENVKVTPSPYWLQSYLIQAGIRPINNVVDITNYIMLLYGQPLHAFDATFIKDEITIKKAGELKSFITLDQVERKLEEDDILITSGNVAVALGGVMGGLDSGVTDETCCIVLEAAIFDSLRIRKTSARLNLISESSSRFEKGVDGSIIENALNHAAYLFKEICNASVYDKVFVDCQDIKENVIEIKESDLLQYLGIEVKDIFLILNKLKFNYTIKNKTYFVTIPNRRSDVSIKADLIEEIARIYGYDKLKETLPQTTTFGGFSKEIKKQRNLKNSLISLGFNEAINYSLISENENFQVLTKDKEEIEILNPLSQERKVLRKELISSLVNNIIYSSNRKLKNLNFFEIGKVYTKENDTYLEETHLAILLGDKNIYNPWSNNFIKKDFFLLKGILENVIDLEFIYQKEDLSLFNLHPRRSAKIMYEGNQVGFIGQLHPKFTQENNLDEVYVLELKLDSYLKEEEKDITYTPISKTPFVERDLSFIIKNDICADSIIETIKKCDKNLIKDSYIFDLYKQNEKTEFKSIACRIVLGSNDTLTDDVITKTIKKVISSLEYKYQITLRS